MPIGAQLPLMVFVGLLGGASYVNIFYNLLHDEIYPEADRGERDCILYSSLFKNVVL